MRLAKRVWDSPTMMTWASLGTGAAKFFVILPLVLASFAAPEVAVWYLMATLMQVQYLLDFGFGVTGARFFAYAMGGVQDLHRPDQGSGVTNHALLGSLYRTLRSVFVGLGLGAGILLTVLGTWMLARPIAATVDPSAAWWAWVVMLAGTTVGLASAVYPTYLQGTGRVALMRRWEAITNLGAIATTATVLALGGGLLAFALATQAWVLVAVLRNRYLARRTEPHAFAIGGYYASLLPIIWSRAWRSGVGVGLNAGVVRLSAGVLAQFLPAATMASYLVAFNILDRLNQFAAAPFYSRLPLLGRLYAARERAALKREATRGILATMALLAVGVVAVGFAAGPALAWIGSETAFVSVPFWFALAAPLLVHRYGALHLQLYTLTNHVVWHVADGVAGLVYLGTLVVLLGVLGLWTVPVGLLFAYGGFYTPYALIRSGWGKTVYRFRVEAGM